MEIAIPHTGKVVLRYLNETLQNQVFQILFIFFVCLWFLCVELSTYPELPWGAAAEYFFVVWVCFFFPFHHSPLSRLHRNRGTIITSDFDKCLGPDLNSSFNFSSLLTQILSYQDNFKTTSSLVQSHLPKSGQTKKLFFFLFFFEEMPHCGEQDGPITLMPWKILNPLASACLASQIGISCKEWWNPLVAQISCLVWRTSEDRFLCLKQSSYGQSFQCHEIDTRPAGCSGVDTQ